MSINISIVLTTNSPTGNGSARNSVEVRVNGQAIVRTYEHGTTSEAYEEAIRYLVEQMEDDSDDG